MACAGQQQSLIERMSKWALSWTKNILIFEGLVLLISPWILLWLFSGLLLAVVKCSVLLVNFFLIAVSRQPPEIEEGGGNVHRQNRLNVFAGNNFKKFRHN